MSDLEFSCECVDGEMKFSQYISETSGYFHQLCQEPFVGGSIFYDGSDLSQRFSIRTVKAYWDLIHGMKENFQTNTFAFFTSL